MAKAKTAKQESKKDEKASASKNQKAEAKDHKNIKSTKEKNDGITKESTEAKAETADQREEIAETSNEKAKSARTAKPLAKAGKRSAKSVKEAEEKQAKESRKAAETLEAAEKEEKPKPVQKPARPKAERRGKNWREAYALIDKNTTYSLKEAAELATKTSRVNFDAAVELHIRLNVDPKQADQNIRGTVVLPAGSGKTIRIAVIAPDDHHADAKKAGADLVGSDDLLAQLDKGIINFDTLIATPDMMPKLGKYAKQLGPKGLMPNPKSGTVTKQITKAVKEAKAGKAEYRVDDSGIIHLAIGKVSFGTDKIIQNATAVLSAIKASKPASVKGVYIETIYISTSMGPSIRTSY